MSSAPAFRFTAKQAAAQEIIAGDARHIMLEGGGRSGKSFLHIRNIMVRALSAPNSNHLIARYRFNHVRASVLGQTFPAVMRLCFPELDWKLNKLDWYVPLPNGARIWFAGLDDKERTEKILGLEFSTIFLNECSQIPLTSRDMLLTRLAEKAMRVVAGRPPEPLKLRAYYDCNPPSKAHWTFRIFHQHVDPETRAPLTNPQDYAVFRMNPQDNLENISPEYLTVVLAGMSARMRRRFEFGEYGEATPGALFDETFIDRWRVMDGVLPDFVRVVVGVDPSGSGDEDNADNDEIGIVIGALGTDGFAYLLEDVSVKAGPATWGKVATDAYDRHKADVLVGEANFGGAMVKATIETARPRTNYKAVTASRGKAVRAEPFSALYEQGKVRHVGMLAKLEDELCAMSTHGYTGNGSPNRADAAIWVLAELFPAIVKAPKKPKVERESRRQRGEGAWMT